MAKNGSKGLSKKQVKRTGFCEMIFRCARGLLYLMPACLFLSYYPVIGLGSSESMNFELSVPLVWLVVFDAAVIVAMCQKKVLFKGMKNKWMWALLPVWLTLSVVWSVNATRGVLTVGIMWLLYIAGYGMWMLRDWWDKEFWQKWWRWFVGATLCVCVWCIIQCVLDLAGVARECSLMCAGCTYRMFGFPHPNGFAIEPQFMGNLLLAPALMTMYWAMNGSSDSAGESGVLPKRVREGSAVRAESDSHVRWKVFLAATFIIVTLFLTFSRGAIYAFIAGMVVMTLAMMIGGRRSWKKSLKKVGLAWGAVVCAFLFTLNMQGVMAEIGPTNDTYFTGVVKVLNHLSLGIIDMGPDVEGVSEESSALSFDQTEVVTGEGEFLPVENPVENYKKENAVFDGYVVESTEVRLKLTGIAMEVWSRDFVTMMFGVGIGGAGQALFDAGLSPSPKEIVQNQYASLLLETGIVGIGCFVLTFGMVVKKIWRREARRWVVISLMVAYGISLCFFSGLANALQIYLMLVIVVSVVL